MHVADVDVALIEGLRDLYWLTGTRIIEEQGPGDNQLIIWDGEPIMVVRHLEAFASKCSTWINEWKEYTDEGPINPYDPIAKVAGNSQRSSTRKKTDRSQL